MAPSICADDRVNVVTMIGGTSVGAVTHTEGTTVVRIDHTESSGNLKIWRGQWAATLCEEKILFIRIRCKAYVHMAYSRSTKDQLTSPKQLLSPLPW